MNHVRTSLYYPQSNGKMERRNKTLKGECIRVKASLNLEGARRIAADFVAHYDDVRLHSAIGYVTPADKLAGRDPQAMRRASEDEPPGRGFELRSDRPRPGHLPESSRGATMNDGLSGG